MKVIAIGGSPRLKGNTNFLIDQALVELAAHGIETEKIILNEYKIGFCQGHDDCASFLECQQKDDVPWIMQKFRQADGVILASPVYCFSFTAQMKTFLDRTYFAYTHDLPMKARCAGLIAIAGGDGLEPALKAMKGMLGFSKNMKIFTVSGFANNIGEAQQNPALIKQAMILGKQMAEALKGPGTAPGDKPGQ
jgi:multimeric flavodoxin WrbA